MSRVTPDDLRQLAHMLETDHGLVAICERLEKDGNSEALFNELKETLDNACVRPKDVLWLAGALGLIGKRMQQEQEAMVAAHTPVNEPYGPEHVAEVKALKR